MNTVEIGGVEVSVDPARTRETYGALAAAAYKCSCAYCQNFRALGRNPFPAPVLAFFAQAGIDVDQPAEIYGCNQTGPGRYLYGGEFYFFGEAPLTDGSGLDSSGSFDFTFTKPSPLAQKQFDVAGAVCFSFIVELPWVIADAP
jgi:hypothetical protein